MNEMMAALEAMIRRVVQEELRDPSRDKAEDFGANLKHYVDNSKPEWAAIVSQGSLDMPWFDDAVKAEAAIANDNSHGFGFASKQAFDEYVKTVITAATVELAPADFTTDIFKKAVRGMLSDDSVCSDILQDTAYTVLSRASFTTRAD